MRSYLEALYPEQSVLHSFAFDNGQEVDCVEIQNQPALKDEGMAGHQIQYAPTSWPAGDETPVEERHVMLDGALDPKGRTRLCPDGSIPVQKLSLSQLRRFRTLDDFRRKVPGHIGGGEGDGAAADPSLGILGSTDEHQYAVADKYVSNWGAETNINVWNPFVEKTTEFSLSQMWVSRGSGSTLETVEVGIQKYQDFYGDANPHLFIYFTPDNYGAGGCYNLSCTAFVQTNNTVVIGGAVSPVSTTNGSQYSRKILWYKDTATGNWWLQYDGTWVGYYPRAKFDSNGLQSQGSRLTFGGEIIDAEASRHTYTDMGSGAFPSAGWQKAAYHRNIRYVNTSGTYTDPGVMSASRTDADCYDITLHNDTSAGGWGRYFYYGGSGYNTNCE